MDNLSGFTSKLLASKCFTPAPVHAMQKASLVKKLMLSALKVKRFQPDFTIFFMHFLPKVITPQHTKRPPNLGKKC
jgi:hypothetical protein